MGNDDYNFMDEYADDEEKRERKQRYDQAYMNAVERHTKGIEDEDEREDLISEFSARHNVIRSGNPFADAEHNILSAKNALRDRNDKINPAVSSLMDSIDQSRGKKGHAKSLLKKAMQNDDDSFFELNPNMRR